MANQPRILGGAIDIDASDKAARFIRFCDCFNIPLVILADVPGYLPGSDQEKRGIIRHGAKMLYAFSEATVPKITIVIRKYYGGAIPAMCCHETGADLLLAWPTAEFAMLGSQAAVRILYKKEIEAAENPEKIRQEKMAEYKQTILSPYYSASKQYIECGDSTSRYQVLADLGIGGFCDKRAGAKSVEKTRQYSPLNCDECFLVRKM